MGSPTLDALNLSVRKIVAAGSGLAGKRVIPTDSNHPAPNGLYATVKDIVTVGEGMDAHSYRKATETTFDINHYGNRLITFSVQFYREGAAEAAKALRMYIYTVLGQDMLAAANLSLRRVSEIRDLNAVFDRDNEPRVSLDIEFGLVEYLKQTTNRVDKVGMNVVYSDIDVEEVITDGN